MGVLGTIFFKSLDKNQTSIQVVKEKTPLEVSKEASKEIKKERQPFFIINREEVVASKQMESKEEPVSLKAEKIDFFNLSRRIRAFRDQVEDIVEKKHPREVLGSGDYNRGIRESLINKYNNFFSEKKLWYKAVIDLDIKNSKMYIFMNYYYCDENDKKKKTLKLQDVCFSFSVILKYEEKWSKYSLSSNSHFFSWKDDTPYTSLDLEGLGSFMDENHLLKMIVPIADEDGPLQFLKYEEEKFSWPEAGKIHWVETTEAETNKFKKSAEQLIRSRK